MKNVNNRKLFFTGIIATIGSLCFAFGLKHLEEKAHKFNPIHIFFSDFDFTDVYYKIADKSVGPVEEILIVNCSNINRTKLAQVIDSISTSNPSVIGVDFYFGKPSLSYSDSTGSILLDSIISKSSNLVLGYRFNNNETNNDNSRSLPESLLSKGKNKLGFFNISDSSSTIRKVPLFILDHNSLLSSFSFAIAEKHMGDDNPSLKELTRNKLDDLIIQYLPTESFLSVDADSILSHKSAYAEKINNKIILLGDFGDKSGLYDQHFTPLNIKLAGRSFPDMSGVYVHANIIYTLLGQKYTKEISDTVVIIGCLFIYVFIICFFVKWYCKYHPIFHFIMLILQLISFILLVFVSVFLYSIMLYMHFEIPYLILTVSPFIIYMCDMIDLAISSICKFFNKKKPYESYFDLHRLNHFK